MSLGGRFSLPNLRDPPLGRLGQMVAQARRAEGCVHRVCLRLCALIISWGRKERWGRRDQERREQRRMLRAEEVSGAQGDTDIKTNQLAPTSSHPCLSNHCPTQGPDP